MAAQTSAFQLQVESLEANQAAPSQDAGSRKRAWFLQGVGLAALMLVGVYSIGGLTSDSEQPPAHHAVFAFQPAVPRVGTAGGRSATPSMGQQVYSRRSAALNEMVEDRFYTPAEAVALMKKTATAKFVETAELHGNLNLDPKFNDQQIRTTVSLPHGTGNSVRVAVLAEGPAADAAKAAGADIVGWDDLILDISGGTVDFEVLIATPAAMPKLAKLGKVLGPKGLMPSPKGGTVSANPADAVCEFKAGKLEFRTDKQGIVHVPFGKADFDEQKLEENLVAMVDVIDKNRPTGCKGKLWKTAAIASSMGPAIKLDLASLKVA